MGKRKQIYQLVFPSGAVYVGCSINPRKRVREFRRLAHIRRRVNQAFRKEGDPKLVILESGLTDIQGREQERYWIDLLGAATPPKGLNMTKGGEWNPTHSSESKRKMSRAHKGKMCSKEHRAKISESMKVVMSRPEARERIQKALVGRKFSWEHRQRISRAKQGTPLSEEHRAKISRAHSGKNNPFYGKTHSPEVRALLSKIHKGKVLSEEHKAKLAAGRKAYWERRRREAEQFTS